MKAEECIDGLKEIMHNINPKADLSNVDLNTNLVNDLGLNSLSMLMMALAIKTNSTFALTIQNPLPRWATFALISCNNRNNRHDTQSIAPKHGNSNY